MHPNPDIVWILAKRPFFLRKLERNSRYVIREFNEILFTKIEVEDISNIWCQQDGATCHKAETKSIFKIYLADPHKKWTSVW